MVSERSIPGLLLDAPLWTRRAGSAGHLRDGRDHAYLGATYPWRGTQRLPFLVAGQPAPGVSVQPQRAGRDMDHAGGRHAAAAADHFRQQLRAELELEIRWTELSRNDFWSGGHSGRNFFLKP